MNLIDKIMLWQFSSRTRESLLPVLLEKQKLFSAKWFRQRWYRLLVNGASNRGLFKLIHDKNLWNEQESVSGPGSTFEINIYPNGGPDNRPTSDNRFNLFLGRHWKMNFW